MTALCFCLTRGLPPSSTFFVPGRALVWRAAFAFNYQSAVIVPDCTLQLEWHPCTPTMSASSLALIHCIMTASAQLMPLKGSNSCLILTEAFMDSNNGVCFNSSVLFFSLKEQPFSWRYSQHSHLVVKSLSPDEMRFYNRTRSHWVRKF